MKVFSNIAHIAAFTIKEAIRSKIFNGSLLVCFIIGSLSLLAKEVSFLERSSIIFDLGLGLASLYSIALSLFFGSSLISNEIELRTLFCILTKPIKRSDFILGKYLGTIQPLLAVNLFSFCTIAILFILNGGTISLIHLYAGVGIFFESLLIFTLALTASLFTNKLISSLYAIIILFFGHTIHEIPNSFFLNDYFLKSAKIMQFILPNFSIINFKNHAIYHQYITFPTVLAGITHIATYTTALLIIAIIIFNRKNFD